MTTKQQEHDDLVRSLRPALAGTPVPGIQVRDESVPGSRYRHLTVVWDGWAHLGPTERSSVILDAFEQAHADQPWRVLEVTLAVGLTTREAQKLKIA